MAAEDPSAKPSRFLLLEEVPTELATSNAQIYALLRSKALAAIKLGGRGQRRVERAKLEEFVARAYDDTARWIDEHPFGAGDDPDPGSNA